MAGRSTARRTETRRGHPARPSGRVTSEPVFPGARAGQPDVAETPAVPTLALSSGRAEPAGGAAPTVVVAPEPSSAVAVPHVVVARIPAPDRQAAAPLPVVETDRSARGCPHPVGARISLSLVASLLLHAGAAAAFVWLSLTAPQPISAGEEGIPVELVAAVDTGAASHQEAASGRHETKAPSSDSQAVQKVQAPPAETPPEPIASLPVETAAAEPPVARPEPITMAQRMLDPLPPPPQAQPAPVPVPVAIAEPAHPMAPPVAPQKGETQVPTELQAAVAPQPAVQSPPPPQAGSTPPVQRVEAPQAPVRREAPTTREHRRPTREVAAVPKPARPTRTARQVESRASATERGDGAGQRNRQQSNATGASGASSVAAVAAWRQRVLAHLARHKAYPELARERGIRGRTGIAFTLTGSGAVASVSIASSSGAPILDQATLAMVRRAQPFPPNPAGGSASFTAGVNYSLH